MFCRNCGKEIDDKAAVCIHCGVSVVEPQQPVINVINNNTNTNVNNSGMGYIHKKKWVAFWEMGCVLGNGLRSGCASSSGCSAHTGSMLERLAPA